MRLLVVLQNAWGGVSMRSREEWIEAMHASRTGLRLARALPEWLRRGGLGFVEYTNASPRVSWRPDGKFPADLEHLRAELARFRPTYVLACGLVAEGAMREIWRGPLLAIPHPASRVLTNDLLDEARERLHFARAGQVALRQRRGRIDVECIERTP